MTISEFNEGLDRVSAKCRQFESLNLSTTQKALIITDIGELLRLGREFKQLTPSDDASTAILLLTNYENKLDEIILKIILTTKQLKTNNYEKN